MEKQKTYITVKGAITWWCSGGGIDRIGPHATQIDAYKRMLLTDKARGIQACPYPLDVIVWPEQKE